MRLSLFQSNDRNIEIKTKKCYILEIMLYDPDFNEDYAYTGLISQTKQVTDAYWMPKNISVCFILFENKIKSVVCSISIIVH